MKPPSNYQKHTSKNPVQKFLIKNFYKSLLKLVFKLKIETILDAGCGEGFTLIKLQNNGIGKELEGIDYSSEAITLGKKMHPSLTLRQGDIYALPYKNSFFDLVICSEVLEHLEHPEKALEEIMRVSKKYCLLSVPNEPLFMISNFLRGKNLSRWGNDIEHINYWSSKSFENFVKRKGVKILIKKNPFPWTMILGEKIGKEKVKYVPNS